MKKYFKPKIVMQVLEQDDVLTTSIGTLFSQNFDNGNDDISWEFEGV